MKSVFWMAAALAAVSIGTVAQADTVSGGSISYSGPTDYSTQLGLLAKFNPDAGTLTGVSFTVGYGFQSNINVFASTASSGNVSTESAASFGSSDSTIANILNSTVNRTSAIVGSSQLDPAAYDLTGNKSIYNLQAGTSQTYSSNASASNTYVVSAANLAAFYASQTSSVFDVVGRTLTGLNLSSTGGNATASQQTTATQSISVLYNFTPAAVPEPGSWMMMIAGFGMIGAAMRHRRSISAIV